MGLRERTAIQASVMGRADGERVRMRRAEKGCGDMSVTTVPTGPEHTRLAWGGRYAALLLYRVRVHRCHGGSWQAVAARPRRLRCNLPYPRITVPVPLRL